MQEPQVEIQLPRPKAIPPLGVDQLAVVAGAHTDHVIVLGAPGSGRTTTALGVVTDAGVWAQATRRAFPRRDEKRPGLRAPLLLVPTRARRELLQPQATHWWTMAPVGEQPAAPLAQIRTPTALAFEVLRIWAVERARPLDAPALLTGAAENKVVTELLEQCPVLPLGLPESARRLPALVAEVRSLFARAGEFGITGAELSELGAQTEVPAWESGGELLQRYEEVLGLPGIPRQLDSARAQDLAAELLLRWEDDAAATRVRAARPTWPLIVVDDLQDCTTATVRLLAALAQCGSRIIAFGDPDVAVETYRGGEPYLTGHLQHALDIPAEGVLHLNRVRRGNAPLRALTQTVTGGIGAGGTGQSKTRATQFMASIGEEQAISTLAEAGLAEAVPNPGGAGVRADVVVSTAQARALLARFLREEHVHAGTSWPEMAVIVRSQGEAAGWRRSLRRAQIPVAVTRPATILAQERAVAALLRIFELAGLDPQEDEARKTATELASAVLAGPLFDIDPLNIPGLRRHLALWREGQQTEVGDLFLSPELAQDWLAEEKPKPLREEIRRLGQLVATAREMLDQAPELALWRVWEDAEVSQKWENRVWRGSQDAAQADQDLDAMMALFRTADIWTQRFPAGTCVEFLDSLVADDIPTDQLATPGQRPPGVAVLTPAQAAGQEWEVVAIAGLQDTSWPNLRIRDSLLGAGLLAEYQSGRLPLGASGNTVMEEDPLTARKRMLDDERRLLACAVSRSKRRLLVVAERNEDTTPSAFFDLVARHCPTSPPVASTNQPATVVPPALDLRGLVARLRHLAVASADAAVVEVASKLLGLLQAAGVRPADPQTWTGVGAPSSTASLVAEDSVVPISPSAVEGALKCPLRWLLQRHGGNTPASDSQTLGTIVHAIAEEFPHGNYEEMRARLEERLAELDIDATTWVGRAQLERADKMIHDLAGYLATVPGEVLVEQPIDATVGQARLRGSIDRVELVEEGKVRVVDLKTGQQRLSVAAATVNPQLACYQVALEVNDQKVAQARLVYVGTPNKAAVLRTQPGLGEEREWAHTVVAGAAEIMGGQCFPARVNPDCRYCPLHNNCPTQTAGERIMP